jgi:Toprim domain-containing protein
VPKEDRKKLTPVLGQLSGAASRLHPVKDGTLGIAEGWSSALAAFELFGVPTWSAISAGNLKFFAPPPEVRHLIIFGDNDKNFVGQAAARQGVEDRDEDSRASRQRLARCAQRAQGGGVVRRPKGGEQFIMLPRRVLGNPAFFQISRHAYRLLLFLMREHLRTGGRHNGRLKAPWRQLRQLGVRRSSIAKAIAELEDAGLIDHWQGGMRVPTTYALKWLPGTPPKASKSGDNGGTRLTQSGPRLGPHVVPNWDPYL